MLGEVGLDRSFRLPALGSGTLDPGKEGLVDDDPRRWDLLRTREAHQDETEDKPSSKFSKLSTPLLTHQLPILQAQLSVAVKLKRNISLHSVKAQEHTLHLLDSMAAQHGEEWLRWSTRRVEEGKKVVG